MVRARLEPVASGFQVRRPNHSATLPPYRPPSPRLSIIVLLLVISGQNAWKQFRKFHIFLRNNLISAIFHPDGDAKDNRDLIIPGRDGLGRLPELSYWTGHAHENSRIISLPCSSRRGDHFAHLAVVSKTWVFCYCFAPTNASIDLIFEYNDKNASNVHIFHECRV